MSQNTIGLQAFGGFIRRATTLPKSAPLSLSDQQTALVLSNIVGAVGSKYKDSRQAASQLADISNPGRVRSGWNKVHHALRSRHPHLVRAVASAIISEPELAGFVRGAVSVHAEPFSADLAEDLGYIQELGILKFILAREKAQHIEKLELLQARPFDEGWASVVPASLAEKARQGRFQDVTIKEIEAVRTDCLNSWNGESLNQTDLPGMLFMDWLYARLPGNHGHSVKKALRAAYFELFHKIVHEIIVVPEVVEGDDLASHMQVALKGSEFIRARKLFFHFLSQQAAHKIVPIEDIQHPWVRIMVLNFYLTHTSLGSDTPQLKHNLLMREGQKSLLPVNFNSLFESAATFELCVFLKGLFDDYYPPLRPVFGGPLQKAIAQLEHPESYSNDYFDQGIGVVTNTVEPILESGPPYGFPQGLVSRLTPKNMGEMGISVQDLDQIAEGMNQCQNLYQLQKYHAVFNFILCTARDPWVRTRALELMEEALAKGAVTKFSSSGWKELHERYDADPLKVIFDFRLKILSESDATKATQIKYVLYTLQKGRVN